MGDFRYALRTLGASRGFTIAAVVTLAIGIGANTAIFSVVNGVLLKSLPFGDADRIVRVFTTSADGRRAGHSAGDFRDLQRENQALSAVAGFRTLVFTVAPRAGEPARLDGAFVTIDYFDVLAVAAEQGRTFNRAVDGSSSDRLAVVSHQAAHDLYGSAERAVGEVARIDGQPHTIVGVLPRRAAWPERMGVWVLAPREVPPPPVELRDGENDREAQYFEAIARVRPDISVANAALDMHRVATLLQERRHSGSQRSDLVLVPLREEIVGNVRFGVLMMQAAVGLVLLIACANVSSLIVARASGRRRELAIRSAIGANRRHLIRQLLTESVVLGLSGGWAGLLLGAWLTPALVRLLPAGIPRADEIGVDAVVAIVTLATALGTSVLFGIMPAIQASRTDAASTLKRAGDRGVSRAGGRSVLVVSEIALTLVLLAGAGLLLTSWLQLQRVESGMQPDDVTLVGLMVPQTRYSTAASRTQLYRRILEGLTDHPEIRAAGIGFPGPLRASSASGSFEVEGGPATERGRRPFANFGTVSGGYFAAMGIPLVSGRTFNESDHADAADVAVVNFTLAATFWRGESAIGKRLRFDDSPDARWMTVVGVVGDVRQSGLAADAPPILYVPYAQFSLPFTEIAIRSTAPQSAIATLVRARLREIDPELPPGNIRTLASVLERSIAPSKFRAAIVSTFAGVALVLAAVGVFGLISYSVAQRTREVGIRVALGADAGQILRGLMREGITLTLLGIGVGLAIALAAAHVIRSFLFGVQPSDPVTLGGVALILLGVAALATYLPARRALRVDPVVALREE